MKGIVLTGVYGTRRWPMLRELYSNQSLKLPRDGQSLFARAYARAREQSEGMEETTVVMTGLRPERVVEALVLIEAQSRGIDQLLRPSSDYAVPNVSGKVPRIILNYTDYVRRVVWQVRGAEYR